MRKLIFTHKDLLLEMEKIRKQVFSKDQKINLNLSYLKQLIVKRQKERVKIGFKVDR